LKSQRAALLSHDTWQEGAFACTHTSIVACTSPIRLLYWLGTLFYLIRQPCYYEGFFSYVQEFSTATVYWRFAHQSTAKHIHWEDWTLSDSITLGKAKGMAEQRLQYPRGMGNPA
jgi:hypothetical protein